MDILYFSFKLSAGELCDALQVDKNDKAVLVGLINAAVLIANEEPAPQKGKRANMTDGVEEGHGKKPRPDVKVDEDTILKRISTLDALVDTKSYSKKKSSFYGQFYDFLISLTPSKTLHSATPLDIRKFLVWIEKNGKTRLHLECCEFRGLGSGVHCDCECPTTMAWGTLDSKVGMLRALYRDEGFGTEWGPNGTNPAASPEVRKHLRACALEQGRSSVPVTQAIPLFLDKVQALGRYMEYHMENNMLFLHRLLCMRDITFFRVVAQTGDRANDLACLQTGDIFRSKDGDYILKLYEGKTISVARPRYVPLFKSDEVELCPVASINNMVAMFREYGIDLKQGYLFRRMSDERNSFANEHITSSAINARLHMHLDNASLNAGETVHGARRGLALTLASMGVDDDNICQHLGWYSKRMCLYYTSRHMSIKDALSVSPFKGGAPFSSDISFTLQCTPENRVFI